MHKYLQIAMMSLLVLSIHAPSNSMELSKFRGNIYTNTLPVVMHFPSLIADADRQFIKSYIMPVIGIASIMICYLAYKYYIAIFRPDRKQPDSSESNLPPRPRVNSTTEDTTSTSSDRSSGHPSPKILPMPNNYEQKTDLAKSPRELRVVDEKSVKSRLRVLNYIENHYCGSDHQEATVFALCSNNNLITLDLLKKRQNELNKELHTRYYIMHAIDANLYKSIAEKMNCIQESINKYDQSYELEDSQVDNYADLFTGQHKIAEELLK